jgi:mannose-6-phosphate isomerase-like protein (cupin superfamily)
VTTIFPQLENAKRPFTAVLLSETNGIPTFARVMENFEGPKHRHEYTDETFIVLSGVVYLDLESSSVKLGPGESYTVQAGVLHSSRVPGRAELIVVGGKD